MAAPIEFTPFNTSAPAPFSASKRGNARSLGDAEDCAGDLDEVGEDGVGRDGGVGGIAGDFKGEEGTGGRGLAASDALLRVGTDCARVCEVGTLKPGVVGGVGRVNG
jgi:hypothetical protein